MSAPEQDASEARLGRWPFTDLANVFLRFICHRDQDATDFDTKGSVRDQSVIQFGEHSSNVCSKDGHLEIVVVALRDVLAKTEPSRTPPGQFESC